jgi:hypothetical protein
MFPATPHTVHGQLGWGDRGLGGRLAGLSVPPGARVDYACADHHRAQHHDAQGHRHADRLQEMKTQSQESMTLKNDPSMKIDVYRSIASQGCQQGFKN